MSLDRAEKTLLFAGQALDPNAAGGPDLALARELLHRAALDAARVLDGAEEETSLEAVIERLKAAEPATDVTRTATSIAPLLTVAEPPGADLVTLEVLVRRLVLAAAARVRGRPGALRRLALRFGLVSAVLVPIMGATATVHDWSSYRYKASSAVEGYRRHGRLSEESHPWNLLIHTKNEKKPSVEIDLGKSRLVDEVLVINRFDCCRERGVPLLLEARVDKKWVQLARTANPFYLWSPSFEPVEARSVRLRAEGHTALNLSDIQVR